MKLFWVRSDLGVNLFEGLWAPTQNIHPIYINMHAQVYLQLVSF